MFERLIWKHDRVLLGDLVFRLQHFKNDQTWELGDRCFVLFKIKGLIEQYDSYFATRPAVESPRVMELGLWEGGSLALWFEHLNPSKHVAVDIAKNNESEYFHEWVEKRGVRERVRTFWEVNQEDTARLRSIVATEFQGPLDFVIDDASHMYQSTKASFEALFPCLRQGGVYIIEDWAWYHWTNVAGEGYGGRNAIPLTRLIFELVQASASSTDLISSLYIAQGFVAVERGIARIDADPQKPFALEGHIRNRIVCGADRPELKKGDCATDPRPGSIAPKADTAASVRSKPSRVEDTLVKPTAHNPDDLIPPDELLFDGCTTGEQFKNVGNSFVNTYLINRAHLRPYERVLDVGSGNGKMARVLSTYLNPRGAYDGIEIVREGVKWCQQKYAQFPNFRFHHADIRSSQYNPEGQMQAHDFGFPFENASLDLILLSSVFTHMLTNDLKHYVSEVSRCLRIGGRAVITFFLLNPESRSCLQSGSSTMQFDHAHDMNCRLMSADVPERAVAYEEVFIRSLMGQSSLSLAEVYYGNWSGRKDLLAAQQDVMIFVRT